MLTKCLYQKLILSNLLHPKSFSQIPQISCFDDTNRFFSTDFKISRNTANMEVEGYNRQNSYRSETPSNLKKQSYKKARDAAKQNSFSDLMSSFYLESGVATK